MLERLLGRDPDKVFPYPTFQILVIKDWLMAIISGLLTAAVIIYTILYVFIILQQYNVSGNWDGYTYYFVSGKAYSEENSEVYDAGDLVYPHQDSSGITLGAYLYKVANQELGYCTTECTIDSDCPENPPLSNSRCLEGYCDQLTWCPNIDSSLASPEEIQIKGVENLVLNVKSGIYFPQYDTKDYSSYESEKNLDSSQRLNLYLVGDLLNEAGIESIDEIKNTGAIIELNFKWKCNANEESCEPSVEVQRLDTGDADYPVFYE